MPARFITIAFGTLLSWTTTGWPAVDAAEPGEPLATFAVISNAYLTALSPEKIIDENGRVREFLAKTAPPSLENTVKIVNELQPDALIVLGSMTWSGSEADFDLFRGYLDRISVPKLVVPGSPGPDFSL